MSMVEDINTVPADGIRADLPEMPSLEGLPSALERLGASPFPKSRFPLLGFLATLYEQVAQTVGK